MTILTFPTLTRTPSNAAFRLRGNSQTQRSPLDGTTQTLELPGSRWEITVSWESLQEADWRTLGAFISRLRGRAGRFTFSPAIFAPRQGVATGSPVFLTAPAGGEVFTTSGWTPSSGISTDIGDWMSYVDAGGRQRLHMSTLATTAAGSGQSSHRITPPIRTAAVIGQPLEIAAPIGVFMLTDDGAPEMSVRPPRLGSFTLTMEEALA